MLSSPKTRHAGGRLTQSKGFVAGPVNGTGTQLSVAWNASARTATIVFKGSTTREDWITVRKRCAADCGLPHVGWQCRHVATGA
jgi:hypothetical protein